MFLRLTAENHKERINGPKVTTTLECRRACADIESDAEMGSGAFVSGQVRELLDNLTGAPSADGFALTPIAASYS
jgi:hypothetical protein